MQLRNEFEKSYQELKEIENEHDLEEYVSEKSCEILGIQPSDQNKEIILDFAQPAINIFLSMNQLVPIVGDHNEMRIDTLEEGGDFL